MGGTTAEWSGSVAQKRGTFAGPVPATAREGPLRATTGFLDPTLSRGVFPWNGRRGCPSKGSTSQQQQQPGGSGGTFPAEYAARAVTARSLHQDGRAGHCAPA